MTNLQIDVSMDYVDIEGQRVVRPASIERSRWQNTWELFRLSLSDQYLLKKFKLTFGDKDFKA